MISSSASSRTRTIWSVPSIILFGTSAWSRTAKSWEGRTWFISTGHDWYNFVFTNFFWGVSTLHIFLVQCQSPNGLYSLKKKLVFFSQVSANTAFDFVPMQRIFKLFGHGLCTVLLLCVDDSALPSSKDVVDTCRCFDYIFQLIWIVWACDDSKKKLGFFREITFKFSNKSAKFFFFTFTKKNEWLKIWRRKK